MFPTIFPLHSPRKNLTVILHCWRSESDRSFFASRVDLFSGVLGLRFHPQFIEEKICENSFAIRKTGQPALNCAGPAVKRLEAVQMNQHGTVMLSLIVGLIGGANAESVALGCLAFQWLIRGWREEDPISRFSAFFTAIEVILEGYTPPPNEDDVRKSDRIGSLIGALPRNEAKELTEFFQRLTSNRRPSLASRFETLAHESALPGSDADVAAFRHFNAVRNKLHHRGEQRVDLIVTLSQTEVRQLQDIAERYVNWVFFRDNAVY